MQTDDPPTPRYVMAKQCRCASKSFKAMCAKPKYILQMLDIVHRHVSNILDSTIHSSMCESSHHQSGKSNSADQRGHTGWQGESASCTCVRDDRGSGRDGECRGRRRRKWSDCGLRARCLRGVGRSRWHRRRRRGHGSGGHRGRARCRGGD